MTLRASRRLGALVATAVVVDMACGEPAGETPDEQSEYADLYLPDDLRACGGQMASYDRFIEWSYGIWAEAPPGSFRVNIHVGGDKCSGNAIGCAGGDDVYLEEDPQIQYHEISHAVLIANDGVSARVINEGTVSALGNQFPGIHTPMELEGHAPEEVFSSSPNFFDEYLVGGAFFRFAIEDLGSENVRDFYRALPADIEGGNTAFEDYRREFDRVFGQTLDETWTTFVSEQRCRYDFWYCDAAQTERIVLPFALDHIDCDAPTSLYFEHDPPESGVKTVYSARSLVRFEDVGSVKVAATAVNVQVMIFWCGDCSQQRATLDWLADTPTPWEHEFDLEEGVKVLAVRAVDPSAPMSLELHEVD